MLNVLFTLPLLCVIAEPEKPTLRGVIVEALNADGSIESPYAKDFPKLKTLNAVSYRIWVLDKEGRESPADPMNPRFRVGDRFRIEIETHTDQYVYVLHEDREGERTLLIPQPGKETPKTPKSGMIVIPDGNRWFRFTPPAGQEILHLIASPSEIRRLVPPRRLRTPEEFQEAKQIQDDVMEALATAPTKRVEGSNQSEIAESLAAEPIENLRNVEFRGIARLGWSTVAKGSFERNSARSMHVSILLDTTERRFPADSK